MKKFFTLLLMIAAGFAAADYFGIYKSPLTEQVSQTAQRAFGRGRRAPTKTETIPVLAEAARREDVPITFDAVGTVQAVNSVVVRAQADGRLLELTFKDGQSVQKGDVLARIDPVTYRALYEQSAAKKAQDQASLANAKIDLDRYARLASGNFGSKQQADTQRALVAQLEAQVRLDQAQIDNAKAVLDYTTITAPIDGRTGLRAVDAGNIVHAADANGIVTIAQMKPIGALFNLPQQQLRAVKAGQERGSMKVLALDSDNVTVIDSGQLEVIDNQVDPTTGTVRIKTQFPNDAQNLWPGQFINIRLYIDTLSQVVVVPNAAVQRGPKGPFVYVVSPENKAVMTPVEVMRQDERIAVISGGLAPPAMVVTTGFAQRTDGAPVRVMNETAPVAADPAGANGAAPPRGGSARGDGQRQGQGQGRRQGEATDGGSRRERPAAPRAPVAGSVAPNSASPSSAPSSSAPSSPVASPPGAQP